MKHKIVKTVLFLLAFMFMLFAVAEHNLDAIFGWMVASVYALFDLVKKFDP